MSVATAKRTRPAPADGWRNRIVGHGEEAPGALVANPANWRTHPVSQQKALAGALKTVGWVQQVLVNQRTGYIIDGHARIALAIERGEPTVPVVYVDLDPDEERLVLATLDPLAAMAERDDAQLRALLAEIEVEDAGLLALLGDLAGHEPKAGLTDPDDVPELADDSGIHPGDLFALGDHRLMCGDSTKAEDVARLMGGTTADVILTDPPYGISLDTDYRQMGTGSSKALLKGTTPKQYRPVIGDDQPFDPEPALRALGDVPEQFWFGADYYRRLLSAADRDGSWLVWDKRNEASDGGFGSGFELIWSRTRHKRDLLRHYFFGAFGKEATGRVHPTQKPSGLLAEILERWSLAGAIVWDGYVGSGTTIIAAEQLGRRCYAMEIDPRYVAVAIKRWEQFTGRTAERI